MPETNTRKIFVVLIICLAIVASVAIWQWRANSATSETPANTADVVSDNSNTDNANSAAQNWQGILSNIKSDTTSVLANNDTTNPTDGTLTAQMAQDFFSQYLALKQNNGTVTADEANQIAQSTLTGAAYTNATGVQYTAKDLHINAQTSREIVQKYHDVINTSLKNRALKNKVDPLAILNSAVKNGSTADLAELNPLIVNFKGVVSDLASMSVPADATQVHLDFLNAYSNILANLESMKLTFSDPVKSFAAVSQYKQHLADLQTAVQKIDAYFLAKLKS